jgi:hypothetical protein
MVHKNPLRVPVAPVGPNQFAIVLLVRSTEDAEAKLRVLVNGIRHHEQKEPLTGAGLFAIWQGQDAVDAVLGAWLELDRASKGCKEALHELWRTSYPGTEAPGWPAEFADQSEAAA